MKLLTSVLLELQKMSETNQDSTSKAPNMQIQQMMMPAPLPNRNRRSQENLMARIQEMATEDALLLDHSAFGPIPAREHTGTWN